MSVIKNIRSSTLTIAYIIREQHMKRMLSLDFFRRLQILNYDFQSCNLLMYVELDYGLIKIIDFSKIVLFVTYYVNNLFNF